LLLGAAMGGMALSPGAELEPQTETLAGETRREALGRFLRERRESLLPEQVGISSHRGRRTPGLRREEVAFLADIGVKWYARLEAGDEIQPSAATLTGIAVALRLSSAELEYMLELAGLHQRPLPGAEGDEPVPEPMRAFVMAAQGVAASLGDRILTPILWNATADALYNYSRYPDPVERNALVRGLFDPEFIEFLGPDREALIFRAVGIFRLNYSTRTPSPYAGAVYERIKNDPLFQRAWKHRVIDDQLTRREIAIRNHAAVGRLEVYAIDFATSMRSDLFVRILSPANEETATKFDRLKLIGEQRRASA
jgi:transcriptional regulator with XRE-family HTH domain